MRGDWNYLPECRIAKVGVRSPKSDLLLEKELVEVSGSKGSPVTISKIPNSFLERKPALLSLSMMQKMPEVLFSFCAVLYFSSHFHFMLKLASYLVYPDCLHLRVVIHIIAKRLHSLDAKFALFIFVPVDSILCLVFVLADFHNKVCEERLYPFII